MKETFTEAMLENWTIDAESEKKFTVWTFLRSLSWMPFTREKQLARLNITEEDVAKYQPEWEEMQKQKKK